MKVLVTGGAGYIGSVTATALEQAGHVPVILDSLISGPEAYVRNRIFYREDIADSALLARIFTEHSDLECTIHMAARAVVEESVARPYEYYRDNVAKSLELFDQLQQLGKPRVVFSSSASVYAEVPSLEVREDSPTDPGSPYARTKLMMEMVLQDLAAATALRAMILRYFNPIGPTPTSGTESMSGNRPTSWASWCSRRRGGATPSQSPGRTIPPATAPVCGTTSTSGTWPRPMSARSSGSTRCWRRSASQV
jgi:UDP-glucose 4-epimerase